ncbi:MAG: hypothetical protein IPL03_15820 [Sterolibacteriaceae bacterium]|jgi:hypothetical protein|nr:hypothetical protein [Candidatus Methylophosphatis haderslevensis]
MKAAAKSFVSLAAALLLSTSALANTAERDNFGALAGIDAEPLALAEMDAIHGAIDFAGVIAAINSSTKLTAQQKASLISYLNTLYANPFFRKTIDKVLAYITIKYGL